MTSHLATLCRALLLLLLLGAGAAQAAGKATLGVFLPTSMADGQERFRFAEELAARLSQQLGSPVVARSFGRYEDFAKAARGGLLDFAVVDAWAAVSLKGTPVALARRAGAVEERWAIVAPTRGAVKDLQGKRLAITKGAGPADVRFVSNVVFAGDLDATRHFKLVPVPNVESALKAVEAKSAEAALVPAGLVPEGMRVLYRSSPQPAALVVHFKRDEAALVAALGRVQGLAPFEAFTPVAEKELAAFSQRVLKGAPRRQPQVLESPLVRPSTEALVDLGEVGLVMPSFLEALDVEGAQPDE